jgi:hypothetical protein
LNPYLSDLLPTLKNKEVDLFNESMDQYPLRQDVIDDITTQLAYEEKRFGTRAKSYAQLKHDVVLWHFVYDKRPARVESPAQATHWIVTVDYHFISFDEFKRRDDRGSVPICLHPTSLVQMLQFWLPRTPEFEEAMLDSLRLPLLFQEFDSSAEKVSVTILQTLARFENADQLPKELVGQILVNKALRQELALEPNVQRQIDLIREAIVEESGKIHSELQATTKERDQLAAAVEEHERDIQSLKARLAERQNAETQIAAPEIVGQPPTDRPTADEHTVVYFASSAILLLALFFALTLLALVYWRPTFGITRTALITWSLGFLIWTTLISHLGKKNRRVGSWMPFQRFVKWRNEIFALIIFAVGWDLFESVKNLLLQLLAKIRL